MKKIGYARVSTKEQKLNLQIDALKKEGCKSKDIFTEKVSGSKKDRPQLQKMIEHLRKGDVVIIWKLDRLGRSLKELIELVAKFNEMGVGLKSINDPIDTTTSHGKLIFNIFACLAEFERDTIRERTKAGLNAARARGRVGGRPKGLSKEAKSKAEFAAMLYKKRGAEELSISDICERVGCSKPTLYNYLREQGVQIGGKN